MPDRSSNSTMPYGVAGGNVGSLRTIMPTFIGCRPSTSFSGSIAICSGSSLRCPGTGSCTMMPWISGSRFSRRIVASTLSSVTKAGRSTCSERIPTSAEALCLAPT